MKIKYQFCFLFLFTFGILACIVSVISYYNTKRMLLKAQMTHLESISEEKKSRLHEIIKTKYEIVLVLAASIQANSTISIEKDSIIKPKGATFIEPLKKYKDVLKNIKDIYLINKDGIIIESFDETQLGRLYLPKDTNAWKERYWHPVKEINPYIEGVFLDRDKSLIATIYFPVYQSHFFIGNLIIDMDANDIYNLTKDYTGLGKTGETIIAKMNGKISLLTPTRFSKDTTLTQSSDINNKRNILYHSFNEDERNLMDYKDYRGKKVIGSPRLLKNIEWALLTKIDLQEAMLPVDGFKKKLMIVVGIGLIIVTIIAFITGSYFSKDIELLIDSANKIKEGDLSKRIKIDSKNEIGTLAITFNEMTEKLDKKILELKHSNESLNKFAYIITHDLKSPAISIHALAQILRDDYQNKAMDEEGKKILDMMLMKTNHMNELIEGVLSSAKEGFKVKEKEWIETNKLLRNVIDNLNPPPHINIIIQPDLPQVHYNKVSLIQIFQNLLSNSIKYMNKPIGIIEIGGIELEDRVKFHVKDNGPGIKESDYNKIFLMFETTQKKPGIESHGIGLSIIKKIITESNGEIWLESEVNKGTTFYFTIPKD